MSDIPGKNFFFIKSGKVYNRIRMDEVRYVFAEGNYSTFFMNENKHIAKISLKQLAEIIHEDTFVRIHRNYIVRFDKIEKIDTQNNKVFIDNNVIPIGKSFKKDLLNQLYVLG